MAITRVSLSSLKTPFKSDSFLAGNAAYTPPGFESIATVTASGGETSLTFSSIPQGYASLQIRGVARATTAVGNNYVKMQFNGVSSASYSNHFLGGDGSTMSSYYFINAPAIYIDPIPDGASLSNTFASFIVDLLDYSSTSRNKTTRTFIGFDTNGGSGGGFIRLYSGAFYSTNAVSSISVSPNSAGFAAGTTFALYGIKGA